MQCFFFLKMSSSNELEPQNFRDRYQKEIFLCSVLGLKKKSSRISILPFKNKIKIFLKRIRENINEIGLTIDFGAFSLNGQMYISENFFYACIISYICENIVLRDSLVNQILYIFQLLKKLCIKTNINFFEII